MTAKFDSTRKYCPRCKSWLLHDCFGKNKTTVSGLSSECKDCTHKRRVETRKKAIAHFGGRCQNPECRVVNDDGTRGCTDERCLQIDHVNSDGKVDRTRFTRNMRSFYNHVMRDTTGSYQLLCSNCNWIKRSTHEEVCAHKIA